MTAELTGEELRRLLSTFMITSCRALVTLHGERPHAVLAHVGEAHDGIALTACRFVNQAASGTAPCRWHWLSLIEEPNVAWPELGLAACSWDRC
jgi:hypothetical protein